MSQREGFVWVRRSSLVGVIAALGAFVVMLVGSAAAQAKGGSTACTGTIGNGFTTTTINGNLTVPPGAECTLELVAVDGNVSVGQGATLVASQLGIGGNLSAEAANAVDLNLGEILGNVRIDATSGPGSAQFENECTPFPAMGGSVCLVGVELDANVSITNTSPGFVVVRKTDISGNLSCLGNASVDVPDSVFDSVGGTASGQCAPL